MKITHVVENLNRGGLERVAIDLVTTQQALGHACQVVCLFEPGQLAQELQSRGIPVLACEKRSGIDPRALGRLRGWIRAHATDVLHTHNAVAHYHAVLASRGLNLRRIVNTRHGMGANHRTSRREWLYRRCLPATDVVVAVCRVAATAALKRGIAPPGKLRVIPNGIRVEAIAPSSGCMRARLRECLGLPSSTSLIGNVGRLNWAKDQSGLIRSFRSVHEQMPNSALILVGDGALRTELEQRARNEGISERVLFLGDRSDVHDLLQGLDVFALSSVSEGYSMALLEACAAALPIVATDVGGTAEIVREGETGVLVAPRDSHALTEALLSMLANPHRASAMGRAARAWVEREGSLARMVSCYLDLYGSGEIGVGT